MGKFYLTTPIYYTNDVAHIGHAYTTIAADVLARYHRQQGDEVLFSTGTDENSQKVVKAAELAGKSTKAYVDEMADGWKQTWDSLGISYDRFIRTTEQTHKTTVYAVFEKINEAGDLYKDIYQGFYCESCEEFKKDNELEGGFCPIHKVPPKVLKETNYFFRLSKYQQPLLEHIEQNPGFIRPDNRKHEVVNFIKSGLTDISVTRETQKWGITYPFDETQVFYVWVEALINYLTVAGYPKESYFKWWPPDLHLVGKEITRFHAAIWPAMLMSAGIELPKVIFGHGFWNVDGHKMSKSLGNVVNPLQIAQTYGSDALRYFLLRGATFGEDGDFQLTRIQAQYDADLADDLGNLVQRVVRMVQTYQNGLIGDIPPHSHDVEPYHEAMNDFKLDEALAEVWLLIKGLNQYVEEEKPWTIAKKGDQDHLREVLAYLASNILQVGKLLEPFMPQTAERIAATFAEGVINPKVGLLFPKFEQPKVQQPHA